MSKYRIQHSIVILSDIEKIKKSLIDFKSWRVWSPWLIMDRDATLTFSQQQGEVGSSYSWEGELVGRGTTEIAEIAQKHLYLKTSIKHRFRTSKSNAIFSFKELEQGVEVTWISDGSLPLFLFFRRRKIKSLISMDYERGLKMFKEYIESGRVASSVDISGTTMIDERKYIGIPNSCKIEDIPHVIQRDLEILSTFLKENKVFGDRVPFTIYNTFDTINRKSKFISCVPVEKDLKIDSSWKKGKIERMEILSVNYIGAYEYIGNGWMTAFSYLKANGLQIRGKKPVGYEFYFTDPTRTDRSKLLTEICIPLMKT